jgi:undecaprenyl-phosphate 4-deoxy-4-formamido-L-arabinose transferase
MDYSIIIPVYNSEALLEELYERIVDTFQSSSKKVEIIFVDDSSNDKSWKTLLYIKKTGGEMVKLIRLSKNYGQHSATFCGLKFSKGKYIITIDDDLQNAPEDILLLIQKIKSSGADVVYGIAKKEHSRIRKLASSIWKMSAKKVDSGLGEGSSFRIFSEKIKDQLLIHQQSIIFIDELLFWYTGNIIFETVQHYPRKIGKSGYSPIRLFKFILKLSFNYSTAPLRLMTYFGITISILSFILGVLFIIRKVFFNVSVPGFTATIVAILFSTSLILIGIGIIGKYLSNIFTLLNNRPSFAIKETHL